MTESDQPGGWRARSRTAWARSSLLAPILTLVGGTAAAQALVFAARPVLTRLYTPDDFGVLTVFTTLVSLGATVASGGYRSTLLLPRSDDRAAGLFVLALGCATAVSLLSALVPLVPAGLAPTVLADPVARMALVLFPVALLAAEAVQTLTVWHSRFYRFRLVSAVRVVQSGTTLAVQLGVGIALAAGVIAGGAGSRIAALGLVGGVVVGFLVGALVGGVWLLTRDRARFGAVSRAGVVRLAGRYQRFPRFSAPAALLNVAATRAPVLLLAVFFGSAVVGQFGVAFGALALPLGLVTGAVGEVFFVRAADAHRAGTLPSLTRTVLRGMWAVTLFPSLAVLVAGPSLFAFVFGDVWAEAGRYAQLTAPWVLLAAIAAPMTALFDVLERQRADLGFSIVMFVVLTGAITTASLSLDAVGTVLVAGVFGALLRVAHLAWMLHLARVPYRGVLTDAGAALVRAIPLVALVAVVEWSALGLAWTFTATVLGGLVTLALGRRALRSARTPRSEQLAHKKGEHSDEHPPS
ncbi:MAG: lipopolysaccharide biosynthesis protein [Bacteroidota bacterium]